MKQEEIAVKKITAEDGKVFAKEGRIFSKEVYLSPIDSPDNYTEVDAPAKENPQS